MRIRFAQTRAAKKLTDCWPSVKFNHVTVAKPVLLTASVNRGLNLN